MGDTPRKGDQGAGVTATRPEGPGEDPGSLPAPAASGAKERSELPGQVRALLGSTHPRQSVPMAVAVAVTALVSGRPLRESLVAGAAVLVVQAVLGIVNNVGDRERDASSGATGNPVADGRIPAGNATFAAVCLGIVSIPLSLQNGTAAGAALLLTLVSGLLYERALRRTLLSWLPWAVSFGLLPAFLSYGGWGGGVHGDPPTLAMTGLAALLGIGVHFLTSLPDLVADNKTGMRHLPLRIALKVGAPRLLVISIAWTILVVIGIVLAALSVGLRQ
jgi:4-hydroxybenzoate polyprenyltransferase